MKHTLRRGALSLFLFVSLALPVCADDLSGWPRTTASPIAPAWGTSSTSVVTLSAWDFQMSSGIEVVGSPGTRRCAIGETCIYFSSVPLPAGATVVGWELDGCDNDNPGELRATLWEMPRYTGGGFMTPVVYSGGAATAGCTGFGSTASPNTVDNYNNGYVAYVVLADAANHSNLSFRSYRVYYLLKVSPAPGTATFGDVPTTHPFFQFIEALAASGVTAGCGNGNFCPNDPLTRGQMAVCLSRALGLHWAP